jgi:hypothetical protein
MEHEKKAGDTNVLRQDKAASQSNSWGLNSVITRSLLDGSKGYPFVLRRAQASV